ncbi:MAG: hypothetical protein ACI9KE_005273 [Polyangiales bacterium]|jgi:hypothetical protein
MPTGQRGTLAITSKNTRSCVPSILHARVPRCAAVEGGPGLCSTIDRMRSHKPKKHRLCVLAAVALSAFVAPSANAQSDDEFQLWSALLGSAAFQPETPRVSLWFDLHARRGEAGTVLIVRPGIGLAVTDWLSLWVGYAWVPVFTDGAGSRSEHRLWQQAILTRSIGGWTLQARTRFEQRFSEAGDVVGFRLRQFVRANWQPTSAPVGVAVWDELFLGLNDTDWGAPAGFDQNRLFIGPFLQMTPWARLEAGYLFVYLRREPVDRIAHTLAINFFVSLRPSR